jgi:hypothetical protein
MVKINLLPRYVVEKRKLRSFYKIPLLLVVLELAFFGWYVFINLENQIKIKKDEADRWTQKAQEVRDRQTENTGLQGQLAKVQAPNDWYNGIYAHNASFPKSIDAVLAYIPAEMSVKTVTISGDAVTLAGATKATENLSYVARCWLNILRSPFINPATVKLSFEETRPSGLIAQPMNRPGMQSPMDMKNNNPMRPIGMMMNRPQGMLNTTAAPNAAVNINEAQVLNFTFNLNAGYGIGGAVSATPLTPTLSTMAQNKMASIGKTPGNAGGPGKPGPGGPGGKKGQ